MEISRYIIVNGGNSVILVKHYMKEDVFQKEKKVLVLGLEKKD